MIRHGLKAQPARRKLPHDPLPPTTWLIWSNPSFKPAERRTMTKPDAKAMATKVPFDTGPIHFVGIGGIGMSGIAEVMLNLGYEVQGST